MHNLSFQYIDPSPVQGCNGESRNKSRHKTRRTFHGSKYWMRCLRKVCRTFFSVQR